MIVVNKIRTAWFLALIACVFSVSEADRFGDRDCCTAEFATQQVATPVEVCRAIAADVSWLAWLSGDSRSKQFHYLDLLELLLREGDDFSGNSPPPYD